MNSLILIFVIYPVRFSQLQMLYSYHKQKWCGVWHFNPRKGTNVLYPYPIRNYRGTKKETKKKKKCSVFIRQLNDSRKKKIIVME